MAYVPLQPDLFAYLFPVCLMDWHVTLMQELSCSHGDSEFHLSLLRGNVLETMVTPRQRAEIDEFFRDSFLTRLDAERGLGSAAQDPFETSEGWLFRLNSLAIIMPRIDLLYESWWRCSTPGRAISLLKYCSSLMYFEWENPCYKNYPPPPLWQNDSNLHQPAWRDENIRFMTDFLTLEHVHDRIAVARRRLVGETEFPVAEQMLHDWPKCRELVAARIQELPKLLKQESIRRQDEWTV